MIGSIPTSRKQLRAPRRTTLLERRMKEIGPQVALLAHNYAQSACNGEEDPERVLNRVRPRDHALPQRQYFRRPRRQLPVPTSPGSSATTTGALEGARDPASDRYVRWA